VHVILQICDMDPQALARDVMRALRGPRSQTAFSRRLGYATNVAYAWEAGRRYPTAAEMLRAATLVGVDVRGAVTAFFYRQLPAGLAALEPTSPGFVAALLQVLRGPAPMRRLAERTGRSVSTVSRLLAGKVQPRLPVFFELVEAASRRLLYLLAGLVDLEVVPAARDEWRRLERIHRLAGENPLFETVPRVLELDTYAVHRPGFIAQRLSLTRAEEEATLAELEDAGFIRWNGARWEVDRERSIETTRFGPRGGAYLRAHWADVAAARMRTTDDGFFSYLVFTTDEPTLARLRELQLDYFRAFRALVASAPRNTRIAVANMHLFAIDEPGGAEGGGGTEAS
jgi:transcriptional regulator with XRE-family HTH domain